MNIHVYNSDSIDNHYDNIYPLEMRGIRLAGGLVRSPLRA